jgi:hypothetical protein
MAEEKCYCPFCCGVHGSKCPEFKKTPKEHLADYTNKTRTWICYHCETTITVTAPEAMEKDWLLRELNDGLWAMCQVCRLSECTRLHALSEHAKLCADIKAEWERRGSPRGDN